jgi:ferredoxin-NADP reductase
MAEITYQGKTYSCRAGETILEAFLRQGVNLPFSCRDGICHVCMQRMVSGKLPKGAQRGIKASLAAKNYFLPCVCRPVQDMEVAPPAEEDLYFKAVVVAKEQLAADIVRIQLEPELAVNYRSGQFLNLRRPDGVTRSYSLASVPGEDPYLELHIKRMKNGAMSNWLFDALEVNGEIDIHGPSGDCVYAPQNRQQNLMLIGTGTGLAPLIGIARAALAAGHAGQIYLYHGSSARDGLYLIDALHELERKHPGFHYVPCVSRDETAPEPFQQGRAEAVAFARHPELAGWRVYLAGNPDMVEGARKRAVEAGVEDRNILADSFVLRELRGSPRDENVSAALESDRREFPPDPEMWAALKQGELLHAILTDFYTQVFIDPVLSPYFMGVTKQRLIEKVYSFLRQVFTGEKMYFGDRPRNSHHWMVIPDDVFDYREKLMDDCIRRHGVPEHLIDRWRVIEESYRGDIVKIKPFGRVENGVEQPFVEGFDRIVMDVGTVCDSCQRIVEPGEEVRYHLRLGTVYCSDCHQ